MGRHFMATIGTGNYSECKYKFGEKICETRFVQEAILEFKEFGKGDRITILLTGTAKKANFLSGWKIEKKRNYNTGETDAKIKYSVGLKDILEEKYKGQIEIETVDIPEGKEINEQWELFQKIFDNIEEGEEVIFDITHGFRTLPLLAMSVLNYAQTLKNITVEGIYYGAYEARNAKENTVEIWNCISFMDIMDWTSAANTFINYGNGKQISDVFENIKQNDESFYKFSRISKNTELLTNNINTCRGKILSGQKKSIGKAYSSFDESFNKVFKPEDENNFKIKPFKAIIERVHKVAKEIFGGKDSDFKVGMATVEWCIKFGLIQQGYTAFEETIKTYICEQYNLDTGNREHREGIVSRALNARNAMERTDSEEEKEKKIRKEIDEVKKEDEALVEKFENIIDELQKDKLQKELCKIAMDIKRKRNDLNHFGFSSDVLDSDKFKKELSDNFDKFKTIVKASKK